MMNTNNFLKKIKKSTKVILISLGIIFFISIIFFLFFSYLSNNYIIIPNNHTEKIIPEQENKSIPDSEQDIIDDCKNLYITDTAKCLVENVKTFYKPRITDNSLFLSFDDLKNYGGDCKDWSIFYERVSKRLGFYATTIFFIRNNEESHQVAFLNNDDGYCILDQKIYFCSEYKKQNGEKNA